MAQARAAVGAGTAASLLLVCQQAPAKKRVSGWQPALWPLTRCASRALTALRAVWASRAASAFSAWTELGTCPRVATSTWIPVTEPGASCEAETAPGASWALETEPGFSRLPGTDSSASRLPGSDFGLICLPLIFWAA